MEPFLTVAAQPAYEMRREATALLPARLAGEGPSKARRIVMPTQFIVSRSSCPLPGASFTA
jgi:DNA-binding LacI/PurR family transcriptional regulator